MVICCAAVNCSNRQGKVDKSAISFHRFPLNDSKRLVQWLRAVCRDNWTPTRYSFLCSEHFTKDCFAKRQGDQNRLLKPTAVPSVFHFTEQRKAGRGHAKARRKVAAKISEEEHEAENHPTVDRSTSTACEKTTTVKEESGVQSTSETRYDLNSEPTDSNLNSLGGTSSVVSFDNPVTSASNTEQRLSVESSTQTNVHIGSWMADTSGISIDDFTPSASGACKFIGSLHSYSFSSKHAREKPSFPREALERKKLKRDSEPFGFSTVGSEKSIAESGIPLCSSALLQTSEGASSMPAYITLSPPTEAVVEAAGQVIHMPGDHMSINDVITSASGTCKLIDSLHSYCFSSRQTKNQVCFLKEQVDKKNAELKLLRQKVTRSDNQVKKLKGKLEELKKVHISPFRLLASTDFDTPLNPLLESLSWMLGTWLSDPPGEGIYPTIKPFRYLEEVQIYHVGQPVLNFSFNAFHLDTRQPMHRECGFIRIQPNTTKVAFVSAQNTGIVEIEEGEVRGQQLTISSHSIARISFAKAPHVQQITRTFRLTAEGKLEQIVSMATETQSMSQHLHITYKKVSP